MLTGLALSLVDYQYIASNEIIGGKPIRTARFLKYVWPFYDMQERVKYKH